MFKNLSNLSFRQINTNEYAFTTGWVFTSKVYILNSEEKKAVERCLNSLLQHHLIILGVFIASTKKNYIIFGLILACIFFFGSYLRYKNAIKKVLDSKEKQIHPRQTYLEYQKKLAEAFSWKEIFKFTLGIPVILLMLVFLFYDYFNAAHIGACYGLVAFSIVFVLICLHMLCMVFIKFRDGL